MNKAILACLIVLIIGVGSLMAQNDDSVLFTVENEPVTKSEFVYIYSKTNGKEATFSESSLKEYLDLYIKFKLKVQRAKELQLDTIPSLQKELEGYRRKLADSYLIDKEVTEKLTLEAYERSKQDVEISHLLLSIPEDASPADTLEIYNKAMAFRKMIETGSFEKIAKEFSDDGSAKDNGGYIGFVNVPFPNGFYNLEKAAYTEPINQLSTPVRTNSGYHILKVHSRRAARGEIEASHLLIRSKENPGPLAKQRIDSIYQALQAGANFEDLVRKHSEDGNTVSKGGYIGFFGINRLQLPFENAAFAIAEDGQYSQPVQTQIGWHIIKRISKRTIQPYQIEKSRLQQIVKKDDRHEEARLAMLERIKTEGKLSVYNNVVKAFTDTLSEEFLTFKWKAPKQKSEELVLQLGDSFKVPLGEFTDFLGASSRKRIRMGRTTEIPIAVNMLFDEFIEMNCMKYEESQLEKKYPEFKYLMGEYEQGILLFEISKMEAWDKASRDTVGLEKHFKRVQNKFRWDERAVATTYNIVPQAKNQLEEIKAYAQGHSMQEVLEKFNTDEKIIVTAQEKTAEKTKDDLFFKVPWKVGGISETSIAARTKNYFFTKIEELIPPGNKTLDEARGFVVADYQDYLEREWVKDLKSRYNVKVNDKVFNSLIKNK